MKRTLIGLALSALVTLFFLWLIVSGFGQLMGMLRGLSQPGKGSGIALGAGNSFPKTMAKLQRPDLAVVRAREEQLRGGRPHQREKHVPLRVPDVALSAEERVRRGSRELGDAKLQ